MAPNGVKRLVGSGPFSASVFKSPVRPIWDPSWAHLGPFLGPSWAHLGPVWGSLSHLGPILGPSWPHLGLLPGSLAPSWAHARLTWTILGHLGAIWPATWVNSGALFGHRVTKEVAFLLSSMPSRIFLQRGPAECAKRLNPAACLQAASCVRSPKVI